MSLVLLFKVPVGLMVLSDGMVHFLKRETILASIYQNYLMALMHAKFHCPGTTPS